MPSSTAPAFVGTRAGSMPRENAFTYAFSQPFEDVSDFIEPQLVLPRIEAERPIFVDDKSSMLNMQMHTHRRRTEWTDTDDWPFLSA